MQAPAFWFTPPDKPDFRARLLAPLSALYAAGTARRLAHGQPMRAAVPVICIGNLNVGGTGKTPACIAIALRLLARGVVVHIVSRGHGGRLAGPVRVDERHHSAADVGDEPLLLSAFAPVWVAKDRAAGVARAVAAGADLILLDDGFQNPSVAKTLSIVVVDASLGFGNGRVLPGGPLREPVNTGLARAQMVLSIGSPKDQAGFRAIWGDHLKLPLLAATLQPLATGMDWSGLRVLAFAGIGNPEKFFATLRALGAIIAKAEPLQDHQPLSAALMLRLYRDAENLNAQLVTTEKDAVRLPAAFRSGILTLPVRLELPDWSQLDAAFDRLLD